MASPHRHLRCGWLKILHSVGWFYTIALALSLPLAFMLFAAHRDKAEGTLIQLRQGAESWLNSAHEFSLISVRVVSATEAEQHQAKRSTLVSGKQNAHGGGDNHLHQRTSVQPAAIWSSGGSQRSIAARFWRFLGFAGSSSPETEAEPAESTSPASTACPLRVYMYDIPSHFNWDLVDSPPETNPNSTRKDSGNSDSPAEIIINGTAYPVYPGSTQRKQHSVAYWLTLDLLSEALHNASNATWKRAAVRVVRPEDAEVFYVPFFSSLSYNANNNRKRSM
jgi:hypothetical protein